MTIGKFGTGHFGGSSSIIETLTTLYFDKAYVNPEDPNDPERDRIVLSKGHAGPALYSTLALKGFFSEKLLETLNQPGTKLPSHCDMLKTPGVDMTTGSLGQGFSAAVGMALAAKIDRKKYTTYCILGDGESQEGQIWEAAMFAANKRLNNLIAFTDRNKLQIDGPTDRINSIEPLADKWRSFKYNVFEIDGHNISHIASAIEHGKNVGNGYPTMIILNTIKGRGIAAHEGKTSSHSMSFTEQEWNQYTNDIR